MKSFIINKLNTIKSIGKQLDLMTLIKNAEWIAFSNNELEVEKYLFLEDSKLLISRNGQSTYSTWNYIPINSSLVIENAHEKLLFKIIVCNSDILVLNIDSTNKYCFLINSISKDLQGSDFEVIQWYLIKKCGIDILTSEQRTEYENEQKLLKQQIENEKKKKQEEQDKTLKRFLVFIGIAIGCAIVVASIINYIEYKKLHPTIFVTEPQNRIAVDLGLSVKWASCNVGANSPEENGNYYGWGDPTGQDIFRYRGDIVGELELRFPSRIEEEPPFTIVNSNYDIVKQNWGGQMENADYRRNR